MSRSILCALALAGCGRAEIWMGGRCPAGQSACLGEASGVHTTAEPGGSDSARGEAGPSEGGCHCLGPDCAPCLADAGTAPRSLCVPGRYTVHRSGSYRSSANGVCGVVGPLVSQTFEGDFELTLYGDATNSGVSRGCIRAPKPTPMPGELSYDIEWRALMTGVLDCATGELRAELRSTYHVVSICTFGVIDTPYFAMGNIVGRYDPDLDGFVAGTLSLHEPKAAIGAQPGGDFTWTAVRKRDAGVVSELTDDDCLRGMSFPDDKFADAGVL